MGFTWTDAQAAAIRAGNDKDILLLAGAGSGKTAVLSERVLQRLLNEDIHPEELLLISFTEKASHQMAQKLEEKILEGLSATDDPEREARFRELRDTLPLAQISTLHAFCWQLVRSHRLHIKTDDDKLRLTPRTRVMDSAEQTELMEKALDRTLDDLYARMAHDKAFAARYGRLFDSLDNRLNDAGFREQLLSDYGTLRSLPQYKICLQTALDDFETFIGARHRADETRAALEQLQTALSRALRGTPEVAAHPYCEDLLQKTTQEAGFVDAILSLMQNRKGEWLWMSETLTRVLDAWPETDPAEVQTLWDAAHTLGEEIAAFKPVSLRTNAKSPDKNDFIEAFEATFLPLIQTLTYAYRDTQQPYKRNKLERFPSLFAFSYAALGDSYREVLGRLKDYAAVILAFDTTYDRLKIERDTVDYSDFEHLAETLLEDPVLQAQLGARFKEIYIDEYQDTSPLQEAILDKLLGAHRFMVGDVKQSIYRFRHAAPELFLAREARYTEDPAAGSNFYLLENFRSHPPLLRVINRIFEGFLTRTTGEIEYNDKQALVPGLKEESGKLRLKILCREPDNAEGMLPGSLTEEVLRTDDPLQMEALLAVREILTGRAAGRPLKDFAILLRTHKQIESYTEVLDRFGIPYQTHKKYRLDSPQLAFLTSFVNVLDNPFQDIPLLTYLRSPLHPWDLREAELLELARTEVPADTFTLAGGPYLFERLNRIANDSAAQIAKGETVPEARQKLVQAMALLKSWRTALTYRPFDEVLASIVRSEGYRERLTRAVRGDDQLADLEQFLSWAETATAKGQSLHDFAAQLERLRAKGEAIEEEVSESLSEDAIRLMTIHASKGLEFNVVLLGGALQPPRRTGRTAPPFYLNPQNGVSGMAWDAENEVLYTLPRHEFFRRDEAFRERAETYRLLYVALTRAKEELLVLGQLKDRAAFETLQETIGQLERPHGKLDRFALETIDDSLSLILASLAGVHPDLLGPTFVRNFGREVPVAGDLTLELTDPVFLEEALHKLMTGRHEKSVETTEKEWPEAAIASSLNLAELRNTPIPHGEVLTAPSKLTVTELTKQQLSPGDTYQAPEDVPLFDTTVPGLFDMAFELEPLLPAEREQFDTPAGEISLSSTEFGSFLHKLFQNLRVEDYPIEEPLLCQDYLVRQLDIWEDSGLLTVEEKALARQNLHYLMNFLASDIAREIQSARAVYRETPFTLAIPALNLPQDSGEVTLVQGMIDLFYVTKDGDAVLVDYKSDRVPTGTAGSSILQDRYKIQLQYYSSAIHKILGTPVRKQGLWVIRQARFIPM